MEIPAIYIAPFFVALLVLIQIPMTFAVGLRRVKTGINFGDGGDEILTRRMRGHGNYIETVPISLLALYMAGVVGVEPIWLWTAGWGLVAGRLLHFHCLVFTASGATLERPAGMILTFLSMLISGLGILVKVAG
ncbi:MAPEG family protein [Parasalinivibrio latis]|uniref:MAPEG family protein n=1 Tax=Parasalinivibrio latis TaxID=2952610 RepID=UPI0030E2AC65